jgi:tRNA U55 pseudouridine synthase TruB
LFNIEDAVSLPQLEDAFRYGYWQQFIYPIDFVLSHWAAVVVSDATEKDIRNGRPLAFVPTPYGEHCRVYTGDGCFLGVLWFNSETEQWQLEKVFSR